MTGSGLLPLFGNATSIVNGLWNELSAGVVYATSRTNDIWFDTSAAGWVSEMTSRMIEGEENIS